MKERVLISTWRKLMLPQLLALVAKPDFGCALSMAAKMHLSRP
jgi:hypothetical protein